MTVLSITADDFDLDGPTPAAGTWFRFRRYRLADDTPRLGSSASWRVDLDADGAAVTEIPEGSLDNALVITSNLAGFRQTIVTAYPSSDLTLAQLLGYAVDPHSVKLSKTTLTAWQIILDQILASVGQIEQIARNAASSATSAAWSADSSASSAGASATSAAASSLSATAAAGSALEASRVPATIAGLVTSQDIPGKVTAAVTAENIPGKVTAAVTAENIPGKVTAAVTAENIPGKVNAELASQGNKLYTGYGPPNGVLVALPGSEYVDLNIPDTDANTGTRKWTKKSGTSNTGWATYEGNTGFRNLETANASGVTTFRLQRRGNWIEIVIIGLKPTGTNATNTTNVLAAALGYGFRPGNSRTFVGTNTTAGEFQGFSLAHDASTLTVVNYKPGASVNASFMYMTNESWPTVLPGTAV